MAKCQYQNCTNDAVTTISDGTELCPSHTHEIRFASGSAPESPGHDDVLVKRFYQNVKKEKK